MSTCRYELIGRNPRWQRTLRHRGLRKLALNSGTTQRSAKNGRKRPKTLLIAAITTTAESRAPVALRGDLLATRCRSVAIERRHKFPRLAVAERVLVISSAAPCTPKDVTSAPYLFDRVSYSGWGVKQLIPLLLPRFPVRVGKDSRLA